MRAAQHAMCEVEQTSDRREFEMFDDLFCAVSIDKQRDSISSAAVVVVKTKGKYKAVKARRVAASSHHSSRLLSFLSAWGSPRVAPPRKAAAAASTCRVPFSLSLRPSSRQLTACPSYAQQLRCVPRKSSGSDAHTGSIKYLDGKMSSVALFPSRRRSGWLWLHAKGVQVDAPVHLLLQGCEMEAVDLLDGTAWSPDWLPCHTSLSNEAAQVAGRTCGYGPPSGYLP